MTATTPGLAGIRRRVGRATQRNAFRAVELYAQGVGLRGRLSNAEVLAARRLLAYQLDRPAFRPDPGTRVEPVRASFDGRQVRGEWVERPGSATRDDAVLLYVHGGAFISGSPRTHRGLTSELARRTELSVFSVQYRLAPEYPFPAAADDVLRAYAWLLGRGVPSERILVAGDSAGGHLALGLSPRAVRAGLPVPAAVVAFSPVVDVSMRLSESRAPAAVGNRSDRLIAAAAGRAAMRRYHPGVPSDHPELLLTADDLSVMPPVLVHASAAEALVADAEAYAEAIRTAGGDVELRLWPRQYHVFQIAFRIATAAGESLDDVQRFVATHIA